ncbi:MAG: VanZ family protein [Bacilli bacterium]
MFWDTLKSTLVLNWPVLAIFLVTMVSLRLFYIRTHREKVSFYKEFFNILAIIYVFILFSLLTKVELNNGSGYNIIPFTEILRYDIGSKLFYYNVIGNILIFIPFGFFVADYVKSKNIWPVLFICTIVSSTVEFVQLNIGRSFDIDDIILNIVGGVVGYLIYVGLTAIKNHLPKFFQKDGIYNFLCIILIVFILIYFLRIIGVLGF